MLDQVPLFAGLDAKELALIEQHAVRKRYRKHTVIIERGDEANTLFVLIEGSVKIYVADDSGREIVLNELGPGAQLGELALLADIPRTASVMTTDDAVFLVLTKRSFMQCLADHPNIAFNLIRLLAKRAHVLTETVSELALSDVYGRVVKLLTEAASNEDGREITRPFTHQQIADRVGSSREMVSKILKDLRVGGYLEADGKRFVLHRKLPAKW
jgi:CRP/FNR family cyclic AMP-dependent transcriptional regulator